MCIGRKEVMGASNGSGIRRGASFRDGKGVTSEIRGKPREVESWKPREDSPPRRGE